MRETIVLIEDEEDLLELIEFNLKKCDYDVVGFLSTKNVEKFLNEEKCSLLIVDRNLKDAEGSEFIDSLRKKGINIPVIFVTAKIQDKDIEEGFLRGGDDYLKKPFNMNELILRVKALISRSKKEARVLKYKDITMDLTKREVFIASKSIELTKLEFELLVAFIVNKDIVLTREFLLENVWKEDEFFQDKTVNVGVSRLIKKIDPTKKKRYIKPIWGVGYSLC